MFQTKVAEKIETHILCSISSLPPENRAICEIMWKNTAYSRAGQATDEDITWHKNTKYRHVLTIQGDQKVSVHLTITVHTSDDVKMAITEYIRNVDRAILNNGLREHTVRRVTKCLGDWRKDTMNNTCNFLYCNHQVNRDFLITLYLILMAL
jgi:hypothetical protein